jgi:hypothetical protein
MDPSDEQRIVRKCECAARSICKVGKRLNLSQMLDEGERRAAPTDVFARRLVGGRGVDPDDPRGRLARIAVGVGSFRGKEE